MKFERFDGFNYNLNRNYTQITKFYATIPVEVFLCRIFYVEDDLDIQDLLRNFLQEVGYEITIASDGMEAIALVFIRSFDLILLI